MYSQGLAPLITYGRDHRRLIFSFEGLHQNSTGVLPARPVKEMLASYLLKYQKPKTLRSHSRGRGGRGPRLKTYSRHHAFHADRPGVAGLRGF